MRRPRRSPLLTVSAVLALMAWRAAAEGRPGDFDTSFNGTGRVTVQPEGVSASALGLAVQPDGKFVLAGHGSVLSTMTLWRLHADGSQDTSFNGTGTVHVPDLSAAESLALRSDGGILAGSSSDGKIAVAAFLPDGQPDTSFGAPGGRVITTFTGMASDLLLQPDNKILAGNDTFQEGSVVRFLANGAVDAGFGIAGRVLLPGRCACLALQSDGKILACVNIQQGRLIVKRLLPNGQDDPGFGQNGTALTDDFPLPVVAPRKIVVREDGRILIAADFGDLAPAFRPPELALAQLLPDGTPDPAFGNPATPGLVRIPFDASQVMVAGLAVQDDGRPLVAGRAFSGTSMDIALARFTAAGALDPAFGSDGRVLRDISNNSYDSVAQSVLLSGGRVLLAGFSFPAQEPGNSSLLLARFLTAHDTVLYAESPGGGELPAGPVDFGTVTIGTRLVQIVLRNVHAFTLTNIQAAITDESHPGEFRATLPPAASLAPGAAMAVTLSLTPSTVPGPRTASVRFTAANSALRPCVLALTGAKATPLEIWRVTWFGSPDNSGPGADANDFDHDGLPNFMEYATRSHPHLYSPDPCQPGGEGAFTYTRPAAALTEFSYTPESAPSPAGPWSANGLTSTILTDDGTVQAVQVTPAGAVAPRLFLRLRVTKL